MQQSLNPLLRLSRCSSHAQDDAKIARAKRRVAAIKGFYVHLLVFALVLAGLFAINAASGGHVVGAVGSFRLGDRRGRARVGRFWPHATGDRRLGRAQGQSSL